MCTVCFHFTVGLYFAKLNSLLNLCHFTMIILQYSSFRRLNLAMERVNLKLIPWHNRSKTYDTFWRVVTTVWTTHTISITNLFHKLTKNPAFSVQLKAYIAKLALLMTDAITVQKLPIWRVYDQVAALVSLWSWHPVAATVLAQPRHPHFVFLISARQTNIFQVSAEWYWQWHWYQQFQW